MWFTSGVRHLGMKAEYSEWYDIAEGEAGVRHLRMKAEYSLGDKS